MPAELRARLRGIAQQFVHASEQGIINPIDPIQLMLNILSLCIFPFVARPLVTRILQMPADEYDDLLARRKKEVSQFVIAAIKP